MNQFIRLSTFSILLTSALLSTLTACSEKDNEIDIPLSEVPANIISTAQRALPGISLTDAEKETSDNSTIYELEGKLLSGEKYEIKITDTGTIVKIELED